MFVPPELASQLEVTGGLEAGSTLDQLKSLYFQKSRLQDHSPEKDSALAELILAQAKHIVNHPSKPQVHRQENFSRFPFYELDIEATLEEQPVLGLADDYVVEFVEDKDFSCVLMLDCSASMAGEKHLLASLAVAVMLLEMQKEHSSVIQFSSDAKVIKKLASEDTHTATIQNFLRYRPKGFTNIARGLEEGLKQYAGRHQKRKIGLLVSDGRSTEGKDPLEFAKQFHFLAVLHLQGPGSYLEASQEIAQRGNGLCIEVEKFDELPRKLYDTIRLISRL